jgi:hypothetical protein
MSGADFLDTDVVAECRKATLVNRPKLLTEKYFTATPYSLKDLAGTIAKSLIPKDRV